MFLSVLGLTVALTVALGRIDAPLRTVQAPRGIVSFEFAGDAATAAAMLASWDATARIYAGLSLGLDYLYLCVYSSALAFACVWAAGVLRRKTLLLGRVAIGIAWMQWLAAACDAIENFALWSILAGDRSDTAPAVARAFASVKFVIVALGLAVAIAAVVIRAISPSPREEDSK